MSSSYQKHDELLLASSIYPLPPPLLQVNAYTGTDEPIMSISFSPDDEKLAGVSADGKLLIYHVNDQGARFEGCSFV